MRIGLCLLAIVAACGGESVSITPDAAGEADADIVVPPADAGDGIDAAAPDAGGSNPGPSRVVAIGDLHGDYASTLEAFRVAGLTDLNGDWIGGDAWAVQVGDQLDRGDGEPQILDFLDDLQGQAEAAGGKLIVLNGNHELMNVSGNFAYVTANGYADYGGPAGRAAAFAPGGVEALRLAERPLFVIVEGTLFAHGGIRPEYAADLATIDSGVRAWMTSGGATPAVVTDPDGIVWSRDYGEGELLAVCQDAQATLTALGAQRMVVAHTVQYTGINSICDDQIWRVDVGLSDYYVPFGAPTTQVLQIHAGVVTVLKL